MSISSFKLIVMTKLLFSLAFLFLFSCNRTSNKNQDQVAEYQLSEPQPGGTKVKTDALTISDQDQQIPVPQQPQQVDTNRKPPSLTPAAKIDWDKKIIKTATVRMEVKDFASFSDMAHKAVRQYGGYIAQEDNDLSDYKSEARMSIKVPVNMFEDLMNSLGNADTKLLERKITSDDVTGEVIDTRSRLEAKKEMRLKYLEFLKQSKNMKEVLEVQSEINSIQEEIESTTARVGFLNNQAAYSTINLSFFQPLAGYKPDDINPSFFTRVAIAFKGGAEWVKSIVLGIIYLWPLILVIISGLYLLRRNKPAKVRLG